MEAKAQQTQTRADGTGRLSLIRKLSEVMGEVERVPKSGHNKFHGYDYATEADIVSAVRRAMAERYLMLVPTVLSDDWVDRPKGRLVKLRVRFTVHDGESGEEMSFEVLGEGEDQSDKATYKAMTGAVKYALLKLFLIPTGDDPEQDEAPQRGGNRQQQGQQQRPQQRAGGQSGQQPHPLPQTRPVDAATAQPATTKPGAVVVAFGPHKGKSLSELSDAELSATVALAQEKLKEQPKAQWAAAMKESLTLLEAEAKLRARAPTTRQPGQEG